MADIITTCQILNSYCLHELAGPLSAIINTTDLFNSSNKKIQNDAFNLIIDGASELGKRMRFYSFAYSISHNDNPIPIETIKKLCNDLFEKTRVKLTFNIENSIKEVAPQLSQIVMCLIITAYNNLLREGSIMVSIKNENHIFIQAQGSIVQLAADKKKILSGALSEIEPNTYNGNEYYCRLLLEKKGYILSINQISGIIDYIIFPKNLDERAE